LNENEGGGDLHRAYVSDPPLHPSTHWECPRDPEAGRLSDTNCLLLEALRREKPTEKARNHRLVLSDIEDALAKGADPNYEHWERTTPLSQAILANRPKAVRRLLEAGARPLDWTRVGEIDYCLNRKSIISGRLLEKS